MSRILLSHAQIYDNSVIARAVGLAGFAVLIWDHCITFADEVELVWKSHKSPLIWLFFLNRYFIPLSFAVGTPAYFSHVWDYDTCNRFVVYGGCMTMIGIAISGLMMFFRIRALYNTRPLVYGFVLFLWAAFIVVNSWLLTHAYPIFIHAPTVTSCTMVFSPSLGAIASISAWLPILFDTTVVSLTLFCALHRSRGAGSIARELAREGLLYYGIIFAVTFTLAVMITATDISVKDTTAQLELCLTATMMSRITLAPGRFARASSQVNESDCPTGVRRAHGDISSNARNSSSRRTRHAARPPPAYISRGRGATTAGEETSFFALITRPGDASVSEPSGRQNGPDGDREYDNEREGCEDEKYEDGAGEELDDQKDYDSTQEKRRRAKGKDVERAEQGEGGEWK